MAAPLVRALVFDVFGTLYDWRSSIARALAVFGKERGIACDWNAFVDEWRAAYRPALDRVRAGRRPWANLDALHAESFDALADRFGLPRLDEWDRDWCVKRWHALDPWPDVRDGLARLRSRYVLGTLSNGNVSLLVDLARASDVRFDAILSAELFGHYKPDPETYRGAAALLGLQPDELMLVAAHNDDLLAASREGLRTAFVPRPSEYRVPHPDDVAAAAEVDVSAPDMHALADRLT